MSIELPNLPYACDALEPSSGDRTDGAASTLQRALGTAGIERVPYQNAASNARQPQNSRKTR